MSTIIGSLLGLAVHTVNLPLTVTDAVMAGLCSESFEPIISAPLKSVAEEVSKL